MGDCGDDERRGDGVAVTIGAGVRVVERVLARDERGAECFSGGAAAGDGSDEGAERGRLTRVAPREVVEQGHTIGVGTNGNDVADRLVDGDGGHRLRIVEAVPRVDADADGDAVVLLGAGQYDSVGVALIVVTGQRPHECRPADLMIVAMDDGRLGGDVGVSEQGEQRRSRVVDAPADGCCRRGGGHRSHPPLRPAVVEEAGRQVEHDLAGEANDEVASTGELADVGQLDTVQPTPSTQLVDVIGSDGENHSLLSLRQPDLPRLQTRVLERNGVEFDVRTDRLGHLADCRREPTRTAVGDGRPQMLGAVEHVDQQLLGDRVADLHAGAGDLPGGGVHRRTGERGSADPVATGCPADQDDPIAGVRPRWRLALGGRADAAAEDQRIGGELVVVEHRPGDRRQADLVAVVGDAGDDPLADAPRVQCARRQRLGCEVGGSEAQHVGDGDRPMTGPEHVADHPADARVGATERFDR